MWVATVNLGDPSGAAQELHWARRAGAVGVVVLGTAGDRHLDDPALEPFWAACESLNLPVAVHAGWSSPSFCAIFDNLFDSLIAPFALTVITGFVDVVGGGVLDRHPSLRVAFLEAGCQWLPFILDRMDHYWSIEFLRGDRACKQRPSEYLKSSQIYLGLEADERLLPYVMNMASEDRFLFASDIPHGDRDYEAIQILRGRSDIRQSAKERILWDNSIAFYGLSGRQTMPEIAASGVKKR